MSLNEQRVREQVEELRNALEAAKGKLVEQNEMLLELTSPPYTYATVVALSEWAAKVVSGESFRDKSGHKVEVDTKLKHLDDYGLGDKLKLHTRVRDDIDKAKEHIVVGFTRDDDVVIQLDGGHVVEVGSDTVKKYWKVAERSKKVTSPTVVIAVDGKLLEVFLPKDTKVGPGDTVTVSMETMQIISVAPMQFGGSIGFVRRIVDKLFSEVDYDSAIKVVFNGKFNDKLEKGDRVVLDGTGTVIVRNLGKEDERFSFNQTTNVTWDSIGGLAEAKQQMIEAVELPHRNQDVFRYYKKKPVKGILLYGPPRCGKTMLGKATATSLANIYRGAGTSSGFIYVKGPEILERWVGVAEATIRQIFARARKHKETYGYPAVVFIDEADALLGKRGSGISSDVEKTIVPMFLVEMDGLEESGALVILATNRPDVLDPAIVGDGRIDRKIKIGRPTFESAKEIFTLNLKGVPLNNGYTHEGLAELAAMEVFLDTRKLYDVQMKDGKRRNFSLHHILNGGMVASIVDQATSIAMQRDIKRKRQEGLCKEDLMAAVDAVERQNRDLNHTDELAEFVHDFREDVLSINRLRQSAAA